MENVLLNPSEQWPAHGLKIQLQFYESFGRNKN